MKLLLEKLKKQFKKIMGSFSTRLPVGAEAFKSFTKDLLNTYDIPDLPSYHHAVASMIMHLGPTSDRAPKKYFARALRKAQANEVAYQIIQDIKKMEKEAQEVS